MAVCQLLPSACSHDVTTTRSCPSACNAAIITASAALQNAHACEGPRRGELCFQLPAAAADCPAGARLARLLPRSRRVILPDSGHAALLERGMDLAAVMRSSGIVPTSVGPTLRRPADKTPAAAAAAAAAAAQNGDGHGHGAGSAADGFAGAAAEKPVLLGIVKDDAAVPGQGDALLSPRPATLFPASSPPALGQQEQQQQQPAATAAAGGEARLDASGSVSAGAAASSAAAMTAVAAASAGGVASTAADAGSRSSSAWQLPSRSGAEGPSVREAAAAAASNGNGAAGRSYRSSSEIGSPADQQQPDQQQQHPQVAEVDKDLAWDQWSQYLAPWRVSARAGGTRVYIRFTEPYILHPGHHCGCMSQLVLCRLLSSRQADAQWLPAAWAWPPSGC